MAGYYNRITDGYRTLADQWRLYLKGRPYLTGGSAGKPVTWVAGQYSWHTHGLAFDIAPLIRFEVLGYTVDYPQLTAMSRYATELGFDWGYAVWGTDKPHFMYTGGLSIDDVIAGNKPPAMEFIPIDKPMPLIRGINRILEDTGLMQYSLSNPLSP